MLLFYSIPIAFGEAITTQVDNFSTIWVLSITYLLLEILQPDKEMLLNRSTIGRVIMLSLCVGFGYLTKPSVGIGFVIFAIWLLIVAIRRKDSVKVISIYLLVALVILVILIVPGLYRNIVTFDALAAPITGKRQLVGTLNPIMLFVNWVKNLTFNMPTVWIYGSSTIIYDLVVGLASILRVNIDHSAISEDGNAFLVYEPYQYNHDRAISPVIVYLLLVCLILYIRNRKEFKGNIKNKYFVAATISFSLFLALLRWEAFVGRYMISYMAVLCPALVGQMELAFGKEQCEKRRQVGIGLVSIVCFLCFAELFGVMSYHTERALDSSRYSGYFRTNKYVENNYRATAEYLNEKGYRDVGLIWGENNYEYPLLVMLDAEQIRHVNVNNMTAIHEDDGFIPEVIVLTGREVTESVLCHGVEYALAKAFTEESNEMYVYERVD